MNGMMHFLLLVVSLVGVENVIRRSLVTATSDSEQDDNLQRLKANFSTPVVDALLKYDGFSRKFDVPYLEVTTALRYAREIAKATAFNPLFENKDGVEAYAMEHLLLMVLPSSPHYCNNLNCVANRIGHILAEVSTEGGFLTTQVGERILQMHAINLAGNILWRLSRLPNRDARILEALRNASDETTARYARLVNLLSFSLKNSSLVSGFCDEKGGLDVGTSEILSRAVCGTSLLGFNLNLLKNMSHNMERTYSVSKTILTEYLEHSVESLLLPSIISETIIFNMIKQGITLAENKVEDVSRDLQKFIMLGITTNRMKLNATKPFVRYSVVQNQRAVVSFSSIMG